MVMTGVPMDAAAASDAPYVFFTEEVEEPTFQEWHVRWHKTDQNPASSVDTWCRQMHNAHTGTHAAWCARQGYNDHYINGTGQHPMNVNVTSMQPPLDYPNMVLRYDTDMDAIMRREIVGGSNYNDVTMTFWYYSDTGASDAKQPDTGSAVGYDFLNVIYYIGSENGLVKHVLWTDSYEEATAESWTKMTLSIPNTATWVGFEFVSGTVTPEGGDAPGSFSSSNVKIVPQGSSGLREGVFIDDVSVVGTDPVEDVPLMTHADPLPVYEKGNSFPVAWSQNDPAGAGFDHVDLYYRMSGATQWTKYATVDNPQGKFTSSPITFQALQDGVYEFLTQGTDGNNKLESWRGVADTWTTFDTSTPQSSMTIKGNAVGTAYSGAATFVLNATDSTSGVDHISYRIDGTQWANYTEMVGLTANGTHKVEYRAVDKAGNMEDIRTGTITIVNGVPGVVFQAAQRAYAEGNVTINFTVGSSSPITALEYSLDGGNYVGLSAQATSVSLSDMANGEHTLAVRARDTAENVLINEAKFTVGEADSTGTVTGLNANMLALAGVLGVAAVGGLAFVGLRRRRG